MLPVKIAAAAVLLAATPAFAESPFDGTWKARTDSMKSAGRPEQFQIKDGTYSCSTCIPAYHVAADGAYHKVAGKDYWDEVAVKVVDDHRVDYSYRKAGKVVSSNRETGSADGGTLTMTAHNTNNGGGVPIDSVNSAKRVGAPMSGAHLTSGSWQIAPASQVSDAALTMTIRVDGKTLHMTSPLGETLDAPIGGGYTLNVGDPGRTMTKVEQPDARTLKMTDRRGGMGGRVATYRVARDGTTLNGQSLDSRTGRTNTFTASKIS